MSFNISLDFKIPHQAGAGPMQGRERTITRQTLNGMERDQVLQVISKMPQMLEIIPIVCTNNNATLQSQSQSGTAPDITYTFLIKKN
jgi:TusA-related sulfurtransferase